MAGCAFSLLTILALVVAACAPAAPLPTPPAVRAAPPDVDLSKHAVPLEAIHFDAFSGGSIPLSRISRDRIESLRDRIPPLDHPVYDDPEGSWLTPDDVVVGFVGAGGSAFAYPVKILNYHEIVNDDIDGVPVLVSYCPLCRSGIVYERRLDGRLLTFGNTSALYESDLVMFDRETGSYWWQVGGRAIVGALTGRELRVLPATTATWQEWRALHPATKVLSRSTGFRRPYGEDPFASFRDSLNTGRYAFPVSDAVKDARLAPGDEVLGLVVNGAAVAYPLRRLGSAAVNDILGDLPIVVFVSARGPSGAAFRSEVDGRRLAFAFRDEVYLDAETETRWSLAGKALEGPLRGKHLQAVPARATLWYAFVAAYPQARVYR